MTAKRTAAAKKTKPRPPNDRGQGRHPVPEEDRLIGGSLRFKAAHWDKLAELGGTPWMRDKIEAATIPPKRSRA